MKLKSKNRIVLKLNRFGWLLLALMIVGLYYPSLTTFFTHDDFFHFKISQAASIKDFLGFFNLTQAPQDWGYFRPLTTQVVYFLIARLFWFNPIYTHLLALGLFLGVLWLIYQILKLLSGKQAVATIGVFLYATSASHFAHLYSLANQELGHALFYLATIWLLVNYLIKGERKLIFWAAFSFLGTLASKEFAITLPFILVLVYLFLKTKKQTTVSLKKFLVIEAIFFLILTVYVYLHVFHYGLIKGDSYQWSFSFRTIVNSIFWYGLWSLNLPEMLVDFVGPGLKLNPNLLKYWSNWIIPIVVLFVILVGLLVSMLALSVKTIKGKTVAIYLFSGLWFLLTLFPVLFLPWHKFALYLTLPLVGVVLALAFLVNQAWEELWRRKQFRLANLSLILFLSLYFLLSCLTLDLTRKTSWLTLGAKKSYRVWQYFNQNVVNLNLPITVVFCDKPEDKSLLWSPTEQLRLALSDNNFFEVFYKDKVKALYAASCYDFIGSDYLVIPSRNF